MKNFINDFILVIRHGRVTFDMPMWRWLLYWTLIIGLTEHVRSYELLWAIVDMTIILIYTACFTGMRITVFGRTMIERFDEPALEKPQGRFD